MLLNKIRKLQKKFSKTGFIMASLLGGEVLLSVGCLSGHRIVRSVQLKQEEVSDAAIGANADTISPEIFKRKLILIQCILGRTFAANIKVFTAYRKA